MVHDNRFLAVLEPPCQFTRTSLVECAQLDNAYLTVSIGVRAERTTDAIQQAVCEQAVTLVAVKCLFRGASRREHVHAALTGQHLHSGVMQFAQQVAQP